MRNPWWPTRHPIQSKYLFIVVMAMLVPTLLLSGCLYFLFFTFMAEQFALPEGIYVMLMPVFYKINLLMILGVPAVFTLVLAWAFAISHRFAGPIERVERELDEMLAASSWDRKIQLRAKDDLSGLVDRINRVIASCRSK